MLRRVATGAAVMGGGAVLARRLLRARGWGGQQRHASQSEAEYREARTRILILGGGWGGISTALQLDKLLADREDVSILLIDRDNSTLFTPLLWPVANGTTNPNAVVVPLRAFQRRRSFHVLHSEVERIDLDNRVVHCSSAEPRPYDVLVIALGSLTVVPDLPGLRERALLFATTADALQLRNRLIDAVELAHRTQDPEERREHLTFVVGGGGDTGVEVAATVADYLRSGLLSEYPWLADAPFRVVVVGRSDRLAPTGHPRVSEAMQRILERKGIEVQTGTAIKAVTEGCVETSRGEIRARTIFWAAGATAPPVVAELPVEHARNGAVMVNDYLRVPDRPEVYVVGDSAWGYDPATRAPLPPTAQEAQRQGRYVARAIAREVRGEPAKVYKHSTRGHMSMLGQYDGVVQLKTTPILYTGLIAWLNWHGYYWMIIPSWRNRIHLLADWILAFLTGRETSQLRLRR